MNHTKSTTISVYLADSTTADEYWLTPTDKQRLKKINSAKAAQEFITAHSLLNRLLITNLQIKLAQLEFATTRYGKPFLHPDLFAESTLYFSLSHSQGTAAVALCTGAEIGVDIEHNSRKKTAVCIKLAQRFFSDNENSCLNSAENSAEQLQKHFFRIWTLKESFLKARGTGINTSLKEISFSIQPSAILLHTPESSIHPDCSFCSLELGNLTLGLTALTAATCRLQLYRYREEYGVYHEKTIDFDNIS